MPRLLLIVVLAALAVACAPAAVAPTATPRPSASPTSVGSPGTGGKCTDSLPSGFTCVTGKVQVQSGAPVGGVCVNVGPVANCPFRSDAQGNWAIEVPSGVQFQVSFTVDGKERAKLDLTPSFLSGGKKEWPTPVSID
jgi:hypothetical protein